MKNKVQILFFGFLFGFSAISIFAETKILDYIKIVVNDEILTNNEVEEAIVATRTQILQSTPEGRLREERIQKLEETAIENLVDELLILDRAKVLKIQVTDDEIEQHINRLAQSNPQITTIYDPEQLKDLVSKDFLKQRVIRREVSANVRVSEEEVQTFCKKAIEQTKTIEIAQILFRGSEEEALGKHEIIKKALAEGTDFGELAKIYSEDPSAKQTGGKLGRFQKGQLLAVIDEVAFSLKKQALSELVKTEFGFHLLYVHDISYQGNCNELSPQLQTQYHNQVFEQKHQASLEVYLAKLRKSAQVIIH